MTAWLKVGEVKIFTPDTDYILYVYTLPVVLLSGSSFLFLFLYNNIFYLLSFFFVHSFFHSSFLCIIYIYTVVDMLVHYTMNNIIIKFYYTATLMYRRLHANNILNKGKPVAVMCGDLLKSFTLLLMPHRSW